MQSSNYTMAHSVLSGGGVSTQSASYINQSTLGQPTPIGAADSGNYANVAGFWYSTLTMIENFPKSLSWLMLLLGE